MSQYQRILLLADPSLARTAALDQAVTLARTTGAALHAALFCHSAAIAALALVDAHSAESARQAWIAAQREHLEAHLRPLREQGMKVTAEAVWTRSVRSEMLAHIREYAPDLVIKDVHLEHRIRRILLTPLDWHLLRGSPAPLLLMHGHGGARPRRVVAAVDVAATLDEGDQLNERVLRAALALAIQCEAELHLAYAFDNLVLSTSLTGVEVDVSGQLYETLHQLHRESFDRFAAAHSVPAERRHFLYGPAAPALAQLAESGLADVVVVGTAGRSGFDHALMGSTAEAILDQVPCNVLALRATPPPGETP